MRLATGILILGMGMGTAVAQSPSIIDTTKAKLSAVQQQKTADSNAALAISPGQNPAPQAAPTAAKPTAAKAVSVTPAHAMPAAAQSKPAVATVRPAAPKTQAENSSKPKTKAKTKTTAVVADQPKPAVAVEDNKVPVDSNKDGHKTISMAGGRRDPFLSPVVNRGMGGSGCSTGKRCLAVDQIALTGIVKSDAGMIAVVVNAMNKAYFLRENDPVFNGYVVKITGDSIIFKETLQDKLGKSFTREVTKKITTPAV